MYVNSVKDNTVDVPCMFSKLSLKIKSLFYNIDKIVSTNPSTNPVQKEFSLCAINL